MDACNLPDFNPAGCCPACGADAEHTNCEFDFETGHIFRWCYKCSFRWLEAPLWNPASPPIFRRTHPERCCPACGGPETDSEYMDNPTSFDIEYKWRATGEAASRLAEVLGGEVASMSPFLGIRCLRCSFVWPELPLNRTCGPEPVFLPHACAA